MKRLKKSPTDDESVNYQRIDGEMPSKYFALFGLVIDDARVVVNWVRLSSEPEVGNLTQLQPLLLHL